MNFFNKYPALQKHKQIVELIGKYDLETADEIMEAIFQFRSSKSDYSQMSEEERLQEVQISYSPQSLKNFVLYDFQEYIDLFDRICLTKTERLHKVWGKKIDEMISYLGKLKWGEDDQTLFKINDKIDKTFEMYTSIGDKLKAESESGTNIGGYEESFIEQ